MAGEFRVLLADADPERAASIAGHLGAQLNAEVVPVEEGERALAMLEGGGFVAVVVADTLLDTDCLELIRKAVAVRPQVPVVMVGGGVGESVAAEAIKAGALEFIPADERGLTRVGQFVLRAMRESQRRFILRSEEEQTRFLERLYRSAFDTAPVALLITEMNGEIIAANEGFVELSGVGEHELIGSSVVDLLTGFDMDKYMSLVGKGRHPVEFESSFIDSSTRTGPFDVIVSRLLDPPDTLLFTVVPSTT